MESELLQISVTGVPQRVSLYFFLEKGATLGPQDRRTAGPCSWPNPNSIFLRIRDPQNMGILISYNLTIHNIKSELLQISVTGIPQRVSFYFFLGKGATLGPQDRRTAGPCSWPNPNSIFLRIRDPQNMGILISYNLTIHNIKSELLQISVTGIPQRVSLYFF